MAGLKKPMYEMLPIHSLEDNSPASSLNQDVTADFPHLDMYSDLEVSLLDKLPSKRGWLHKKSPSIFKSWQRRYFILYNKKLKYYKNAKEGRYLGIIDFDLVSVQVESVPRENPTNVVLSVAGHRRQFVLRGSCTTDVREWTQTILRHILLSEGNRKLLRAIPTDNKFWKYDRISESQFRDMACTGDLLLFTGKNMTSKVQRSLTRSEYDHVAMILRYNSGMVGLLEATDTEGVCIILWDSFMRMDWRSIYTKIVFKHLYINRSTPVISKLEDFIKEVRGKRYRITPAKLLSSRVFRAGSEESFFCSELVASAYKAIGILPEDAVTSKFWPGDFADNKKLELVAGELSEEILIDFGME